MAGPRPGRGDGGRMAGAARADRIAGSGPRDLDRFGYGAARADRGAGGGVVDGFIRWARPAPERTESPAGRGWPPIF